MIDKIVHPIYWTTQNKFVVKNKKNPQIYNMAAFVGQFSRPLGNGGHINLMGSVRNDDNLDLPMMPHHVTIRWS